MSATPFSLWNWKQGRERIHRRKQKGGGVRDRKNALGERKPCVRLATLGPECLSVFFIWHHAKVD